MASRRAATLIELMVVVSIIGTMAAVLLPSVQAARESSRANTCRNNLRQTGVALLNFESAHRHFPMGAKGRFDPKLAAGIMYDLSWWADTIGFMGETAVVDQLDRKGANIGWVYLNTHNGEVADGFAPEFWFCPSSSVDRFAKVGKYRIAAPSYSGISGATDHDGFRESRVNDCCGSAAKISGGGVLIPNAVIRSRQIADGLAKTLLVGEQSDFAYTDAGGRWEVSAAFTLGWLAGTVTLGTPPKYTDLLARSYNVTTVRYCLNEHRYNLPGINFDGGANNPLLSSHPGIVHLLYCDGSVHVAADSMAVDVLKSLATRDDDANTNQ